MEWLRSTFDDITFLLAKPRQCIQHALNLGCVIFGALMIWKGFVVLTNCQNPVVVVLSGSMEPAFYRGDVLFLYNPPKINVGDVTVFQLEGRDIPIVHRVINLHEDHDDNISLLTKGDNNSMDDRPLYNDSQLWLQRDEVLGIVKGFVPKLGMVTIWMNDHKLLKYGLVGFMGFLVLLGKE